MDFDWLPWLALVVTVGAARLGVTSQQARRRIGFWAFLGSNALWGWQPLQHAARALLLLQLALAGMNVRGARRDAADAEPAHEVA